MPATQRQILDRHRASLAGRLRLRYVHSHTLSLRKPFYVYEPPGLATHPAPLPILYLFRGHEREWANPREDTTRQQRTAVEEIDRLIVRGTLPPLLAVLPGLNSANNHVPSLGIDMAGDWSPRLRGLGTGRFWQFLTRELLPRIERDYPESTGGPRLMAGFSLGGFTVSLLATHLPGYFDHAGIYDGLFMWPRHHDPRQHKPGPCTDPVWCRAGIFDPALGAPRDPTALQRWNPTDLLCTGDAALLHAMQRTTFWITCAAGDGSQGNRDRALFFVDLLKKRGLSLGFESVVLHPEAAHTWHWTDRFLIRFLKRSLATG